jgi:sulfite reductase (NADPH) flavoprotein alpha-component
MPFLLKRLLFRLHWITGLTAGGVLAVVGVTGGLVGFEQPLLALVNPQLRIDVPTEAQPLAPDRLIAAAQAAYPELRARRLAWNGDDQAVSIRMARGRERGGEEVMVDPYTAHVLGTPRGTGFFHGAEDLHRRLAAGPVGKQIVGASTALLLLMIVTGLVLRWPKHMRSLRAWLKLDVRLRGRSFLWHLHAIVGTWVLAFYLVAALTGLWWSYDFYRDALNGMAGVSGSLRPRAPPPGDPGAPLVGVDTAWAQFRQVVPDATRATMNLGNNPQAPLQLRYQTPASAHERAWNTLTLDAASGAVQKREIYADLPRGRRFIGALYPLHAGSFFGKTGLYLMSVASLLMPLFFVTGVWLWLQRRRNSAAARRERRALVGADGTGEPVLVLHASQSGTAERLAWRTAEWLRRAGLAPRVAALGPGSGDGLGNVTHALFVVSSYGDGGPPDSALGFVRRCMHGDGAPDLSRLKFAVLALGNRRYEEFCGFGRQLSQWLGERGAHLLFPPVEAHEAEAVAVARWRAQLGSRWNQVTEGDVDASAPAATAVFADWPLRRRERLNPDSDDAGLYALDFAVPASDAPTNWQPGDLLDVEVAPAWPHIDAWLRQWQLDPQATVELDGRRLPLREALRHREPPHHPDAWSGVEAQALVERLPPLGPRSYSIASLPHDGVARVLVRRNRNATGTGGLASDWLCEALEVGAAAPALLRACPRFHAPAATTPLLLVANGVGIAPFLGMLEQRAAAATHAPTWLVYGERHPRHDTHALAPLQRWRDQGVLTQLDVCFSRAGDGYVQDRLRADPGRLREWIGNGAHVMVCGSPAMGGGVHAALADMLGADAVEALHAEGRYRRELF